MQSLDFLSWTPSVWFHHSSFSWSLQSIPEFHRHRAEFRTSCVAKRTASFPRHFLASRWSLRTLFWRPIRWLTLRILSPPFCNQVGRPKPRSDLSSTLNTPLWSDPFSRCGFDRISQSKSRGEAWKLGQLKMKKKYLVIVRTKGNAKFADNLFTCLTVQF